MNEKLIDLELAKLARQKGYNWATDKYYKLNDFMMTGNPEIKLLDNPIRENYNFRNYPAHYLAPTLSQLQRWLKTKHNWL